MGLLILREWILCNDTVKQFLDDVIKLCYDEYNKVKELIYMATTNLNVRVDEDVKRDVEEILDEIGLNMSTAINVFLKRVVREKGIPFEMRIERPNAETIAAIEDIKNGRNLIGPFDSVEEMMEALNAED